jgi:hypothetical protein
MDRYTEEDEDMLTESEIEDSDPESSPFETITLCLPFRNTPSGVMKAIKITFRNMAVDFILGFKSIVFFLKYYIARSGPFSLYVLEQANKDIVDYLYDIIPKEHICLQTACEINYYMRKFISTQINEHREFVRDNPIVPEDESGEYFKNVLFLAVCSLPDVLEINQLAFATARDYPVPATQNKKRGCVTSWVLNFVRCMNQSGDYMDYVEDNMNNDTLGFLGLEERFGQNCQEEYKQAKKILLTFFL